MPATEQDKISLPIHNWDALQELEEAQEFFSNDANGEVVRLLDENYRSPDTVGLNVGSSSGIADLANREALRLLEQERDHLSYFTGVCGAAGITSGAILNPAGFLLLALIYNPLSRVAKLGRTIKVMRLLLEEFKGVGIQIFPCLKVPGHELIDLFVIFPERVYLLISIRSKSKEEAKVVYSEGNETLYVKHKGRRLRKWQPCPLVELSDYHTWLSKNRRQFGISADAIRKYSVIKTLILFPPMQIERHNEHLYTKMGDMTALAIPRKGTIFVIQEAEILEFVKGCLTQAESKAKKKQ